MENGAGDGGTLALAGGEFVATAIQELLHLQGLRHRIDTALAAFG